MVLPDPHANPLWLNLALFVAAAAVIWLAGSRLSVYVDVLSDRLGLGKAFIGMVLLGVLVSIPEIAVGVTAALANNPHLAINNAIGEIPLQVAVILAVTDAVAGRDVALTFFTPTPLLMLQGVLLVLLLGGVAAAILAGEPFTVLGVGFWAVALFVAYLAAAYMVNLTQNEARWQPIRGPAEPEEEERKARGKREEAERRRRAFERRYASIPTRRIVAHIALSATLVLVAGVHIARTGDAIATQTGLSASLVGALLLAFATSLPEFSTAFSAARIGSYQLAVGDILGSNMLKVGLLPVLDVAYRPGSILDAAGRFTAFAALLGAIVTCVYLVGIIERRDRLLWRMGVDSWIALTLYAGGVLVLYTLA